MFDILCRFIHSGWAGLVPGLHPWTTGGVVGWPDWMPVYPFEGVGVPEIQSGWPSAVGSAWRAGRSVEAPLEGTRLGEAANGDWVRVGPNFFILLRGASGLGASWPQAWELGLTLRVLLRSFPHLDAWAAYDRDVRPQVDPSYAASIFADYTDFALVPDRRRFDIETQAPLRLRRVMQAWLDGSARWPVHVIVDPDLETTGYATGNSTLVRLRMTDGATWIEDLVHAARLHWARLQYGPVLLGNRLGVRGGALAEWIPEETVLDVATRAASIEVLAHEISHLVWARSFGAGNLNPSLYGAGTLGGDCATGPQFNPAQSNPEAVNFPLGSFSWERDVPVNEQCVNKHWASYQLGLFATGLADHSSRQTWLASQSISQGGCQMGSTPKTCRWPA